MRSSHICMCKKREQLASLNLHFTLGGYPQLRSFSPFGIFYNLYEHSRDGIAWIAPQMKNLPYFGRPGIELKTSPMHGIKALFKYWPFDQLKYCIGSIPDLSNQLWAAASIIIKIIVTIFIKRNNIHHTMFTGTIIKLKTNYTCKVCTFESFNHFNL